MKIVWDEPKRLANIDEHGLDFADLTEAFFADALFSLEGDAMEGYRSRRARDHLRRVATLGTEAVSVISMRPASLDERKLYAERLKKEE